MYEIIEEKTTKQLNQLEIDNIIDESINLYIISDLLDLKLITEKQFSRMEYIIGNKKTDVVDTESRLIIL